VNKHPNRDEDYEQSRIPNPKSPDITRRKELRNYIEETSQTEKVIIDKSS
jgi:hypothetical protein